jgi:hypothetical protein
MRKLTKLAASAIVVCTCATFGAIANTSTLDKIMQERYLALAKMCEYYPDECIISTLGAGNGGGNEPPYTPRKPKKEPKKPNKEI